VSSVTCPVCEGVTTRLFRWGGVWRVIPCIRCRGAGVVENEPKKEGAA
jgi:hypothetical protein